MKKIMFIVLAVMMLNIASAIEYTEARPNIQVGFFGDDINIGETRKYTVEVTGIEDGTARCELGLYPEQEVRLWHGGGLPTFSIIPLDQNVVTNCIEGEPYVMTKQFGIGKGEKIDVEYSVFVPTTFDPDISYVLYANCFNHCYMDDPATYSSNVDTTRIDVHDPFFGADYEPIENHCQNNYYDPGKESDRNCGIDCDACVNFRNCESDSDCQSGYCAPDNICRDEPLPEEEQEDNNSLLIAGGIGLVLLVILFAIFKR